MKEEEGRTFVHKRDKRVTARIDHGMLDNGAVKKLQSMVIREIVEWSSDHRMLEMNFNLDKGRISRFRIDWKLEKKQTRNKVIEEIEKEMEEQKPGNLGQWERIVSKCLKKHAKMKQRRKGKFGRDREVRWLEKEIKVLQKVHEDSEKEWT